MARPLTDPSLYLNRELSWLSFNERVLEEASDDDVPLFERLKFASIVASNLDEFFMVRVAGLMRDVENEREELDLSGLTPLQQLVQVREKARAQMTALRALVGDRILPALAEARRAVALVEWPAGRRAGTAVGVFS